MEGKGLRDKLGLKKLDMKLIQTTHVNVLEPVLTIHYNQTTNDWEIWSAERCAEEGGLLGDSVKKLKVLTYNVWFGSHNYAERLKEQRKIFQETDADIICLQEVTEKFQNLICSEILFAQKYYLATSAKLNQSGLLIFSKYPFSCKEMHLQSNMNRSFLLAELNFGPKRSLFICTSHLESNPQDNDLRKQQLQSIKDALHDKQNVIIAADTNIFENNESQVLLDEYDDVWSSLVPNDPGYTVVGHTLRQDRIFFKKKSAINPVSVQLIGEQPLPMYEGVKLNAEEPEIITPSDHYGVISEFEFQ